MLVPLNLPPGIRDAGTELKSKGRWTDCNFVRWIEGIMQPVGKWVRTTSTPLTGRASDILTLQDNVFREWVAVGTHNRCYVLAGSDANDVTPADFTAGYDVTYAGGGYGAADYGREEYGTARTAPSGLALEANSWSLARWGEFLLATCVSDGRVFVWEPGDLTTAADDVLTPVAGAPVDNRALIVTSERHLMLLGAGGDARKIQWSARENYNEWTPTALNLAGDLTLETGGTLQTAVNVGGELLVMSDIDVFSVRYVGQPYGYGRELVGEGCGAISAHAAVAVTDFAVWMSADGFYMYRGQVEPVRCDVWDFVFRDLNYGQRAIITSGHNSGFSEVWWFFPAGGEVKNTRYVVWNYRDNIWYTGYLERNAWQAKGVSEWPLAVGQDGHVYQHEHDLTDLAVQPRPRPYVRSAPFELGNGDNVMVVTNLVPDRDSDNVDALRFEFVTRYAPRLAPTAHGYYYANNSGFIPVRFSGRQITLKVEANSDTDWRLGVLRADAKVGGKR